MELSMAVSQAAVKAKLQHVFQRPWFFTGVTRPFSRRSYREGRGCGSVFVPPWYRVSITSSVCRRSGPISLRMLPARSRTCFVYSPSAKTTEQQETRTMLMRIRNEMNFFILSLLSLYSNDERIPASGL